MPLIGALGVLVINQILVALLLVSGLSSCSSIEFEYVEPNSNRALIVIDKPDVSLFRINSQDKDDLRWFYNHEESPRYINLTAGEYILSIQCLKTFVNTRGDETSWISTDRGLDTFINVESNKRYFLSCSPDQKGIHPIFVEQNTPNKKINKDT